MIFEEQETNILGIKYIFLTKFYGDNYEISYPEPSKRSGKGEVV